MRYTAVVAALVGATVATLPTTIDPCPAAPTPSPKVTITEQFQTVSLCVPTSTCSSGTCTTSYPLATTSVYVSTVIPCAVSGTSASTCTVTATDEVVPCSVSVSTITSVVPVPTSTVSGGKTVTVTSFKTSYTTTSLTWNAPYNMIGPLGIPGYSGSDLCSVCKPQPDGSRSQVYQISDCIISSGAQPMCRNYPFTYTSTVAPSSTAATSAICSSQAAVNQAGVYTYTFPQVAPAATITANGGAYTVAAQPWWAYVTQTASGPTTFSFVITVTKTITYYSPQPKTPTGSQTQWGSWSNVAMTTKSTPTSQQWGDWSMWSTPNPPKSTTTSQWSQWTSTPTTKGASPTTMTTLTTTITTTMTSVSGIATSVTGTTSMTGITSMTGTTSVTGTTTVTGVTTTTSSGALPAGFEISVITNAGQRFRKRSDTKFVTFSGDDGEAVTDESSAALFYFDSAGNLKTGTQYIASAGTGFITFEKMNSASTGPKFIGGQGEPIVLPGASFCVADGALIISFGSKPSDCTPCSLFGGKSNSQTTTTTTKGSTTTTTTSSGTATSTTTSGNTSTTTAPTSTTTKASTTGPTTTGPTTTGATTTGPTTTKPTATTTADPSGDLDAPEPKTTSKPKVKRVIRGMRY